MTNKIEVWETGKGLFAKVDIEKDEIIGKSQKNFLNAPTKYSLQIDENRHIQSIEGKFLAFKNHSCNPNTYYDFELLGLRTLRRIKKGEELSMNYLASEWDMAEQFDCQCGANNCFGKLKGFKYLTLEQKKEIEFILSPFLKIKWQEELRQTQ